MKRDVRSADRRAMGGFPGAAAADGAEAPDELCLTPPLTRHWEEGVRISLSLPNRA